MFFKSMFGKFCSFLSLLEGISDDSFKTAFGNTLFVSLMHKTDMTLS